MKLEIGPGKHPQPGFKTVDVDPAVKPDFLADAAGRIPLEDGSCELVFASHVLEHIPWYQSEQALREWVRVLQPGGVLEVWVPNGYKICKALVDYEEKNKAYGMKEDGWYRNNARKSPYLWAAGRIFTYGDGKGDVNHPNWHRSLFTPRYLVALLQQAGLKEVRLLDPRKERRGPSHGWIDMGADGCKRS